MPRERRFKALTKYVDVFLGTNGAEHACPDASVPFGVVKCGPNFDTTIKSCAYDSTRAVRGFGHLGFDAFTDSMRVDVNLIPIAGPPQSAERTSHRKNERAIPGYYGVDLVDHNVRVDITVTSHAALHRYYFPDDRQANVLVEPIVMRLFDMNEQIPFTHLEIVAPNCARGCISWEHNGTDSISTCYFQILLSQNANRTGFLDNEAYSRTQKSPVHQSNIGFFAFDTLKQPLLCRIGFSFKSAEQAERNLINELGSRSFEYLMAKAHRTWNRQLNHIVVNRGSHQDKVVFYSALYRTCLIPIDALGECSIYTKAFVQHTNELTPLFELIIPERMPNELISDLKIENQTLLKDSLIFRGNDSTVQVRHDFFKTDDPNTRFPPRSNVKKQFNPYGNVQLTENGDVSVSVLRIWQMLGLYPIDSEQFAIHRPMFGNIRIRNHSKHFEIELRNSNRNQILLDEEPLSSRVLKLSTIRTGGHLVVCSETK